MSAASKGRVVRCANCGRRLRKQRVFSRHTRNYFCFPNAGCQKTGGTK